MTWKSINVSNFTTPPPGLDKRSSKADEFSFTYKANPGSDTPEGYVIRANLAADLQINLDVTRPASVPGFKTGKGPKGGFSYFGTDPDNAEGYVVHRFWPRTSATGMLILNGKAITAQGPGMFVHAIQGMRADLIASRWNFAHFQSQQHGGVSGIMMEFTTTDAYGKKGAGSGFVAVNVGSVTVGGKLAAVTAETRWPGEAQSDKAEVMCRAIHSKKEHDADTSYEAPTECIFQWAGPSVDPAAPGTIDANLTIDYGSPSSYKGLIEKVDVLSEIPYVIKTMVNYVAGTKPFIYQVRTRMFCRLIRIVKPSCSCGAVVEPSYDDDHWTRFVRSRLVGGIEGGRVPLHGGYIYLVDSRSGVEVMGSAEALVACTFRHVCHVLQFSA